MTRPVFTPLDGVDIIGTDEITNLAVTDVKLATAIKVRDAYATLTLAGSYTGTLRYKRLGNTVFLEGTVAALSGTIIGTLPSGFQPSATVVRGAPYGNITSLGLVYITISVDGMITSQSAAINILFDMHFEVP